MSFSDPIEELNFTPSDAALSFPAHGDIHVWSIPLTASPPHRELLSSEEISRLEAFRFAKDQNRFLHTHVATRVILASYLETSPAQLQFGIEPFGKPSLANSKTPLEFNLSHSHEQALLAVSSDQAVGIDLEYKKKTVDFNELAKSILSHKELTRFISLPPTKRAHVFFRTWSAKESFLKCLGTGLQVDPREVDVTTSNNSSQIQTGGRQASAPHFLTALPFHSDYASFLCTPAPVTKLKCFTYQHRPLKTEH